MELSAIASGIGILEGMISNAIYDLLKSRLKKDSLTKDDIASIVYDALHETQDVYLEKYSEILHRALGEQNDTLVSLIVQRLRKLLEQYTLPRVERSVSKTEEARQIADEIAQDIGSHLIEHSQLFLLISKEMLKTDDFKRSFFMFAQAKRFLRKTPEIFEQMLREYLAAAEEEALRRSLKGDPESAIVLYEKLLPPYRLILRDSERATKTLDRLVDYSLAKKDLETATRYYKLFDREKAIELYERMGRYRDVIFCYELEGQLQKADDSYRKWQDKKKEWEATRADIKRKVRELKKSRKKRKEELSKLRKSGKMSKRDELLEQLDWPNEQTDLELEGLMLLDMEVKSYSIDDLSVGAIIKSWREALHGPLHLCRPPKSEEQYVDEGLFHLAAISHLRSRRNDLAREFLEKAIERFDKMGHQKALEGDFTSSRIFLEKFCCQILIAVTEIGPDMAGVKRDSYGWKKLNEASKTLQTIFEINHQKKTGSHSKELLASIVNFYHSLRIGLLD